VRANSRRGRCRDAGVRSAAEAVRPFPLSRCHALPGSAPGRAMTGWSHPQRRTMMSRLDERHRRILTTHTGSLPRSDALTALLFARLTKQPYDAGELAHLTTEAVATSVKTQAEAGIDVVSDGEQSKTSFQAYAADRLAGI